MRAVILGIEFINPLLQGVEAHDRKLLAELDSQRKANITKADDGNFEGRCSWVQHGVCVSGL